MTKIKICGLRRLEDVDYVNECMPDYVGFVFWPKSKRNLTLQEAKELRKHLNPAIKSIGVFVDREFEDMVELVNEGIISGIQLHGNETEETIHKLRETTPEGTLIIKAFEVKDESDLISALNSPADEILVDSGKGSGVSFDWNILTKLDRNYFLAGGLGASNVGEAVKRLKPYAVDVSSKVETDGYKDFDKIKAFCDAVRSADAE